MSREQRKSEVIRKRLGTYINLQGIEYIAGVKGIDKTSINPLTKDDLDRQNLIRLLRHAVDFLYTYRKTKERMAEILRDETYFDHNQRKRLKSYYEDGTKRGDIDITLIKLSRHRDFKRLYDKYINKRGED